MSAAALLEAPAAETIPVLEPTTRRFLDGLAGAAPIYTLTPDGAREVLRSVQAGAAARRNVAIADHVLPVGPTGSTRIRILRPADATGALPVLMYFHGAGWVMGDPQTHDRLVRELAVEANVAVVFVDYERSPEHRFPIAIEQDYAATKYIAEHGAEFGLDASRLAIGGDSVGGNMAAVVAQLAKLRNGPNIAAQLLFYPVTDARMDNGSYREFAEGPWLTKTAMAWFWNAYLPDVEARRHPAVSPLNASVNDLVGLPQALVITSENDVLRDEGEAYARKLSAAGVPVVATRYEGTIHDFVLLKALAQTPATRAAIAQAASFVRNALAA